MADKAWKAFERRVAHWWATARNALSGGNSKITRSDTLDPMLFIDCKQRAKHPIISGRDGYDEIAARARVEMKVPVLVLGEKNREGFWLLFHERDAVKVAIEVLRRRQPELLL
jgi:hypothetical protein